MTRYRKRPVTVDAIRLPQRDSDEGLDAFHDWCDKVEFSCFKYKRDQTIAIETLEGTMQAGPGDWIIKGVKGEFYPCKPDIFEASYEPVDEPQTDCVVCRLYNAPPKPGDQVCEEHQKAYRK